MNEIVSTAQLAEVIGKSSKWINELTRDGVLEKEGRGKYDLAKNVQRYISYVQDRAQEDNEIDYRKEQAAHERAKREKAELQLALMKGQLHRAEHVEEIMNDMIAAFRSKMLGLPTKSAPQVAIEKDVGVIQEMLTQLVHEALLELSEYNPKAFANVNDEYVEVEKDDTG